MNWPFLEDFEELLLGHSKVANDVLQGVSVHNRVKRQGHCFAGFPVNQSAVAPALPNHFPPEPPQRP